MRRSAAAVTSALAVLGLGITAASAHPGHHGRPASPRIAVDGYASDWDGDAATVTLDDPGVAAVRRVRRLVRRAGEVEVVVGPRTRIVTEDDAGDRERVSADDLFAALDDGVGDVEVEAAGVLSDPGDEARGTDPQVTARRIVVHLPAADSSDPGDGPGDGAADPGDSTDAPPADPGA